MELLIILLIGALLAILMEVGKFLSLPVPPEKRKLIYRSIMVMGALVLAYLQLKDQPDVTVAVVLTYAAGIITAAEWVYQWVIKQIAGGTDANRKTTDG